jgi:phosphatidyl-myo-inositol alpha-mannosyltransferase
MKIGIVTSYFYPWYGGITEHVYYQYRELKRRGHSVKIITPFDGMGKIDRSEDLIRIGKPVPLILNGSVVKIPIVKNRKAVVEQILDSEKFDILHLHQPLLCVLGLSFLECIKRKKKIGIEVPKVVGTFHACGGGTERFFINRLGFYFRRFKADFDYRIAVSAAARDFIRPVLAGEFDVIPNGVDIDRFSLVDKKIERFDDGVCNILFLGRLEPRKGLTSLLRSVPFITEHTSKPFRVIIVGNGPMTNYYHSRVPKTAREHVRFVGDVSFEDVPRYYKTAHIFCSPATYGESFGIVLIEAMAAGVPIVAGNNEGYRNVINNNVNGILVDPQDPEAIAKTLARLIDSEDERIKISRRSRIDCKRYCWPGIIREIEDAYYSIMPSISPFQVFLRRAG